MKLTNFKKASENLTDINEKINELKSDYEL